MTDPLRIACLLPSATEMVCALGLEECLVGRSHECDFPPSVARLPACTASRIDPNDSSAEIHQQVTAALGAAATIPGSAADALSIYTVDAALLDELRPDLIITQSQCEVCAVSLAEVEAAVCAMVASKPRILSVEPMTLEDVWNDIERIGQAADVADRATNLVTRLNERVREIGRTLQNARTKVRGTPTVACIEWLSPLMAAGNWVPQLVALAGGANLLGETGKHSPWLQWDRLADADPDVIVIMPCGFSIEHSRRDAHHLTQQPHWPDLRAVRNGRVYIADGHHYFNRPGPRLVESLEILAEILHPGVFDFGHIGAGWQRL